MGGGGEGEEGKGKGIERLALLSKLVPMRFFPLSL